GPNGADRSTSQEGLADRHGPRNCQTGRMDKVKTYLALVEKDKDSAFGVRFPDIPGVFSAADNQDEIVANSVEALQLWAEDMPLPAPSLHEDIIARDDVRIALAS